MAVIETSDYAGFWKRFYAWFIDSLILGIVELLLYFVCLYFIPAQAWVSVGIPPELFRLFMNFLMLFVALLYFILFEASLYQASPGKIAVGIKITNYSWKKPSFWQVVVRNIVKIFSYSCCLLGYIFYFFSSENQTLHDKVSRCIVALEAYQISTDLDRDKPQ